MWEFTCPQRIRQKEILSRLGTILFIVGFPIFIGSLLVSFTDFNFPFIESIVFLGQFSIYLGATLIAISIFLTWNSSPFWDFFFNQLSVFLVILGFLFAWWNSINDKSFIQGGMIIFIGLGLIGLGRRFSSSSAKMNMNDSSPSSETVVSKASTTHNPKSIRLDLQQSQTMKSVVGAIVYGFFGIIFSLLFRQPVIILIAIFIGLLVGVDKKQESLRQNLRVAFLNASKMAVICLCISVLIGAGFVSLLFGFNASALFLGAVVGGMIGFLFGALMGAL
jgi:hypothetical protein